MQNELEQVDAGLTTVEAIFELHHAFVQRALAQLGVERVELDDALQEVFIVVQRRLRDYQEKQKLKAWLYSVCRNVASHFRRTRRRRREHLTDALPETSGEPIQLESVANRQALELAARLLLALPPHQRDAFLLYEVEQLPLREVAAAVDCPVNTAYSRLKKARERVVMLVSRAQRLGAVS